MFTQFQETAIVPGADQELLEFLGTMVVHAAAGMACAEIFSIQRQVFMRPFRRHDAHIDVRIARQATPLAAVGLEAGDGTRTATHAWQPAQAGR